MSTQVRIVGKIRNSFRSDTLRKWETNNPILLDGEIGVVIGLNEVGDGLENKSQKIKIGDGIHTWKELSWFSSGGTSTLDIDQTYNPESTNAQSGVAVAEAVNTKMDKTGSNVTGEEAIQLSHITEYEGSEYQARISVGDDGITLSAPSSFYSGVNIVGSMVEISSSYFGTHIHGNETHEESKVRIEDLVEPTKDGDAVNLGYLNTQLGGIETALDNIIAIQNELIGGEDV